MGIYITEWKTRSGKTRAIKLYRAWKNLNGRVKGLNRAGNGSRPWAGLPNNFAGWREFREWAIANGYSREKNSLDRIDAGGGYGPSNCAWLTVAENSAKMQADIARERALHPDDVVMRSNEWSEEQRWLGVPF